MTAADQAELQGWFPDKFLYRADRDSYDYVYSVDDLADLKGRKFQKKSEPRQPLPGRAFPV